MGQFCESVYGDIWRVSAPGDGEWLLGLHGGLLGRYVRAVEDALVCAAYRADRGGSWANEDWDRTDVEHKCRVWLWTGREPVATVEIYVTRRNGDMTAERERVAWVGFRKCLAEDSKEAHGLATMLYAALLTEALVSASSEGGALHGIVVDIRRVLSYRLTRDAGTGEIVSPTWICHDFTGDLTTADVCVEPEKGEGDAKPKPCGDGEGRPDETAPDADAGKECRGKPNPVLDTDNIPPQEVYDRVQNVTERVYVRVRDFHRWVLESRTRPAGNANCERFMYDVCTTAEGRVLTKAWDWDHGDTPYYRDERFVGTFEDADSSAEQIFTAFRDAVCLHCGLDPREHVLRELERHDGDVWTGAKLELLRALIEDEAGSFNGWLSESGQELRRIELRFTCKPHLVAVLLRREGGAIVCLKVSDTCDGLTAEEAAERITSEFETEVCAGLGLSYGEYASRKSGS